MSDQETVDAVDRYEHQTMFLIATDHHTGLDKPYESWVPDWQVGLVLSPTCQPVEGSLDALALSMFRLTKTGAQSKWYVKAGPVPRAGIEQWYADRESRSASIQPESAPAAV